MRHDLRTIASVCLFMLTLGVGVTLAYPFRRPSWGLLGFTAFLAFTAPLLTALPAAICCRRSRVMFVALVAPIIAFAVTKIVMRLLSSGGEPLPFLALAFVIAVAESAMIAWPIARLHASRGLPIIPRIPFLASLYGATIAGLLSWLAMRGNLPPRALWLSWVILGSAFAISFVPLRFSRSGQHSPIDG